MTSLVKIGDRSSPSSFPIVGIGASAGGLEAFEHFFSACPSDLGMAFVLVSHLHPKAVSMLTEILQRHTTMPINQATDQVAVKPNCVYVIPPNRDMKIFDGKLQLTLPIKPHGQGMPIDVFFKSLAMDQQTNAIGIVFSGTGSDGTLGLQAIFAAGGLTLAQDPDTALYNGMPTSAIKEGHVTQVLTIEQMPNALVHRKTSNASHVIANVCADNQIIKVDHINTILGQIRTITGVDFTLYKKNTIARRIERRMYQHEIQDVNQYIRYIKTHRDEAQILFKQLLINVTTFFRDDEAFETLANEILPLLCKDKPSDYVFRVWVPGCSTGEEAYTIAILLHEHLLANHQNFSIQIFSTDLSQDAIDIARAGVYSAKLCENIGDERLLRYFTKVDAGYQINKSIREMIVFAVQNVAKDPPFTKLDFISCRNLMIYLEQELQNRVMATFNFALKPNGVLFLSPSESVSDQVELFTPINRKWKFYTKIPNIRSGAFSMSDLIHSSKSTTSDRANSKKVQQVEKVMKQSSSANLSELCQRVLVQCFAPVAVITDLTGNILYVHGDTGKYLRPAPGQASLNVVEMAREGLEVELRLAIRSVVDQNTSTFNREVQVKYSDAYSIVNLSVRPIPNNLGDKQPLLLISFMDVDKVAIKPKRRRNAKTEELDRIEMLERDLTHLKENHQVILEEQQASNEELKSTNEELQSTNEELQSTNEELETSKEELQSVNEELITVNADLQTKMELLHQTQNDMKNLLDSVNIGIVFLDKHLKIRSYTREAVRVYPLIESDVGRPLIDIKPVNDVVNNSLIEAAQTVLDTLIPHERELQFAIGTWVMVRIQPYRTLDNYIDGVVMSFTDISIRMQVSKDALSFVSSIVNTVREPLIVLDSSLKVVSASRSFYTLFHVSLEDTIGHMIFELGNGQWDATELRSMLDEVLSTHHDFDDYEIKHDFPVIGLHKMRLNARRMLNESNKPELILLAIEPIL